MRLTTLGTSHGDPTRTRFNSATLIESDTGMYLVDAGEPVTAQMVRLGKDFDKLKGVFVTHMHGDHVGGLPVLIKMMVKHSSEGRHADIHLPEEGVIPPLERWLRAMHIKWPSPVISLKVVREGVLSGEEPRVEARATGHISVEGKPASFAYLFSVEEKRILFTGDLRSDFSDFPAHLPCDVCVCEATHYDIEEALPVLEKAPVKRYIFNHVADRWHGEGEKRLKDLIASLPVTAEVAEDGKEFIV